MYSHSQMDSLQMKKQLTRRQFIQKAFTAGSVVSVAGISILPDFQSYYQNCDSCGFRRELFTSHISQNFCANCGINIHSLSFPTDKKCTCIGTSQNKKEDQTHPPCCQVPFPAHGLTNSTKPTLNMADLRF